MKFTLEPRTKSIAASATVGTVGAAATAYHVDNMTSVVMTAGSVAHPDAIDSVAMIVDGSPFTLSLIPAPLKVKIVVGISFLIITGILAYSAYLFFQKEA